MDALLGLLQHPSDVWIEADLDDQARYAIPPQLMRHETKALYGDLGRLGTVQPIIKLNLTCYIRWVVGGQQRDTP